VKFSIHKYVKLNGKWRYCPAVLDRGVPVKDMVLVNRQMEHHTEGAYYFRVGRDWVKAGC
jgi:hypothetical protein